MAIGTGYNQKIGTRISKVDNKTTEYYNTQTGQGFSNPNDLANFVNQNYSGANANSSNVFGILSQNYNAPAATPSPSPGASMLINASNPTQPQNAASTTPSLITPSSTPSAQPAAAAQDFYKYGNNPTVYNAKNEPLSHDQYIAQGGAADYSNVRVVPGTSPTPTAQQTYGNASNYTGSSVTDFLKAAGQPNDFASRAKLAAGYGISNYTGTAAQNTQLLGLLRSHTTGNVSNLGIPNNIMEINGNQGMPSINAPIPATALSSTNSGTLNDLLGAYVKNGTIDSTTGGLLSLLGATTDSEKQYDDLTSKLTAALGQLGNEGADLQAELDKNGVGAAYEQVKQLNLKAAQLKGQLESFDAETAKGLSNIEDQPIPTGLISGQQAQYQKQRNLTRIAMNGELAATIALSQAFQGNAELGTELAQKAVDIKYQPVEAEINQLQAQIKIAGEKMDRQTKKSTTVISALLEMKQKQIDEQKTNEKAVQTLAVQAAANGAPLAVVNAMTTAATPVLAASLGSKWIKGNLESVAKTTSGSTKTTFTQTQVNNGAQNAGLTIDEFKNLNTDVQNFFVNGSAGAIKSFNDVILSISQGQEDPQAVIDEIKSSNLPQAVKDYMTQKISSVKAPEQSGGFWSGVGNFFGNAWNKVKSIF